jgi:CopA family copper-resistance protein
MPRSLTLRAGRLGGLLALGFAGAAAAQEYDLTVDEITLDAGGFTRSGIGYNGSSPGPVLRFRQGEEAVIRVTNNLDEATSVHWHGLILSYQQDGVPGISFEGIAPGATETFRFPLVQAGTYWYHSHSGFQEPDGAYGAIVIEPEAREPYRYDRDYVVQLTDAHPHGGDRVFRNLKTSADYYNREQRTLMDLIRDTRRAGLGDTLAERSMWGAMRMMPTDVEDVQGFVPLINGRDAEGGWTGLFTPGERVRLRLINSSAMTYFDLRIPGLKMTVVAADGNDVQPVTVDELRIGVAETYDVIVRPTEERAYTIFAESMGRTGYARGTLAPREGMEAEVPEMREPPLLTMADMGVSHERLGHEEMGVAEHVMPGGAEVAGVDHEALSRRRDIRDRLRNPDTPMERGELGRPAAGAAAPEMDAAVMAGMERGATAGMDHAMPDGSTMAGMASDAPAAGHVMPDGTGMAGMDHSAMGETAAKADPFYAVGSGLIPVAAEPGGKVLSYADLKAQSPLYPDREPTRELEIRLTGNMERYIWSMDGVKYEDAEPIRLKYGERVRITFVNETMMTHPMHLHGMWSILENGNGPRNPIKHTVSVAPGAVVSMEVEVDAEGQWAFHCHLAYHADAGMFRKVIVEGGPSGFDADKPGSLDAVHSALPEKNS